jgi:ATP-dependent protease ClpP protease subunit
MTSWYTIRARATGTEVLIYDEIGAYGVSAKGFLAELGALPDDASIDLRINSPGGSVFDAVAIYNALKRHAGAVNVWIDGIAASAASYIAMAGDTVTMPENAFLMIHDPSGLVMGTAEDMRATAEALDKVKTALIQGYAAKSGKPDAEIAALLTAETWLDAADAVEMGFADQIAEPVKLVASFDIARFRNAPPALAEAMAETVEDDNGNGAPTDVAPVAEAVPDPDPVPEPAGDVAAMATATATAPDAASIRAEAMAHARAVIDLCRLAGQPQMAGRFLEDEASLDAVRACLLALKADAAPEISSAHAQPGPTATTKPWGEVIARTFPAKG